MVSLALAALLCFTRTLSTYALMLLFDHGFISLLLYKQVVTHIITTHLPWTIVCIRKLH